MNRLHQVVFGMLAVGAAQFLTVGTAVAQTYPAAPAAAVAAPAPAAVVATSPRYLAANCANCHGTNGNAAAGFVLAGLKKDYIVEQMAAFKSGKRQATIMHQIAKGYSDAQIVAMADYFSQQTAAK